MLPDDDFCNKVYYKTKRAYSGPALETRVSVGKKSFTKTQKASWL